VASKRDPPTTMNREHHKFKFPRRSRGVPSSKIALVSFSFGSLRGGGQCGHYFSRGSYLFHSGLFLTPSGVCASVLCCTVCSTRAVNPRGWKIEDCLTTCKALGISCPR